MSRLPTPEDVLSYWIGTTSKSAADLPDKNKLWFGKSDTIDAEIRDRFLILLEDMSGVPFSDDWAERGPRERLAAIIVLDQFSRNVFRGTSAAFAQDSLARRLCKDGLALEDDQNLSETESIFFYLPLEHSEAMSDQELSVKLFTRLAEEAREEFKDFTATTRDYAVEHMKVIEAFGRFPHRNAVLGRTSTPEEAEWLAEGGGF